MGTDELPRLPADPQALWALAHRNPLRGVRSAGDAYRLHEATVAFPGNFIRVFKNRIRLPNGFETQHEIVMPHAAVSIVAVLEEIPGRPEIILVEQFRSTVEGFIHEIPAGVMDPREEPLACARRELLEETGYGADRWTPMATIYPTPGFALERMHFFLAEGLHVAGSQNLDPGECIQVKRIALEPLIGSLLTGIPAPGIPGIVDGKTWIGILYLAARRGFAGAAAHPKETER